MQQTESPIPNVDGTVIPIPNFMNDAASFKEWVGFDTSCNVLWSQATPKCELFTCVSNASNINPGSFNQRVYHIL